MTEEQERKKEEPMPAPSTPTKKQQAYETEQKHVRPLIELGVGDFNRLYLKPLLNNASPVEIWNRCGRGMGQTLVLDLTCDKNGISWEEPTRVYVKVCKQGGNTGTKARFMSLCKLIATNRQVFGSCVDQCPFEIDPKPYTKQEYAYWVDALKHCYWMASAAAKDIELAALQLCKQETSPLEISSRAHVEC